ncbi:Autophagy-related protein 13 [Penicillium rolfsii]|nr:Autophagy-related protein 13 [Penicillium rolfsii]
MHQHPRSPAVPSPAPKMPDRSSAARDDLRDSDSVPPSPTTEGRSHPAQGLGIDGAADRTVESSARDSGPPGKEAMTKLNQIISNYHTKAALIILHSRVELPPAYAKNSDTPKVNRWFNVELEDTDVLREQLWTWRTCDATTNRPPPLIIETYLDCRGLTNNQSLVILDDNGKRWDVQDSITGSRGAGTHTYRPNADEVILERWRIELGEATSKPTAELGSILPTVYKKSIVLFRSLFTYSKFLPAWKFSRNIKVRWSPALQVKYRVLDPSTAARSDRFKTSQDNLTVPLYEGSARTVETYSFGTTESPAGPFSVNVTYRTNCDFRIDDSEALLSSRFMGADDDIFRPSLPSEDVSRLNPETGSVPVGRRTVEHPDPSRAYGSLSTFHQVGPTGGTSPISALRAVRDSGIGSSSPSDARSRRLLPPARIAPPTGRAAQIASESLPSSPRRPSISFQAFKAPPLSASPALVDTPLGVSPRTTSTRLSTGTSAESRVLPPPSSAASARRPAGLASEQAISSSTSASPKPAPISRYSSSFSHRRGRPSTGGTAKTEDENSSGKASAASSNVQPGSGLLTELTGTSAESFHADDQNISEFLKELESGKNLLNTSSSTSTQRAPRKPTSASVALGRFQRMRDSNAALSDSISSSMHLHRSSTSSSKQLSGVPPMISGTSISTASSPGKPISPHTPHTPAIRSRLSSNSVADEVSTEHDRRGPHVEHDSPLEENPSLENTETGASAAGAIDIPTTPRVFTPAYRRSSSAAQHRRSHSGDDEEIFNLVIRSMSMGAETPAQLQQRPQYENPDSEAPTGRRPTEDQSTTTSGTATRGQPTTGRSAASSSSNLYQPRFASYRGRGFSGGHSLSSASSSLARGANIPPHLVEREDHDGTASGSNSGNSTTEIRRGSLQRPGLHRAPPSQAVFEDDEPLLFAMSDFGASRRSLEENRHGNHGADSSGSSRRGSGRRGAGLPGGW